MTVQRGIEDVAVEDVLKNVNNFIVEQELGKNFTQDELQDSLVYEENRNRLFVADEDGRSVVFLIT